MTRPAQQLDRFRPWPHRLACVLVCATFPLIWVGGLVTTYDAGMAVPDWPSTYGYNLLLYPWQSWLAGPWDLFIEHGHRLLGALVGMLTIGFVIAVWLADDRWWLRFLAIAALAAVVGQGVLGGQRVLLDSRTLAMVHGCVGPAFFALCVALAVITSRWWRTASPDGNASVARLSRLALVTLLLAYGQLILGAQLRHRDEMSSPGAFQALVVFHLIAALALVVHAALLTARGWMLRLQAPKLARPAIALLPLLLVQVGLGAGAWVFKYGWPAGMFGGQHWAQGHLNVHESLPEVLITTGHVATGSLILATTALLCLRSLRLSWPAAAGTGLKALKWEAAR